jgi:hypothetical protein
MEKDKKLSEAARHFLRTYPGALGARIIYERYAFEQMEFTREEATQFAVNVAAGKAVKELITNEAIDKFFLWYYDRYVIAAGE